MNVRPDLNAAILAIVARSNGICSSQLRREYRVRTGETLKGTTIFKMLRRMESEGLIACETLVGRHENSSREEELETSSTKFYCITPKGKEALGDCTNYLKSLLGLIDHPQSLVIPV